LNGKTVLWLGNLLLIAFVTVNGLFAVTVKPLMVGLAILGVYSAYLALSAARRRTFIAPAEVAVPHLAIDRRPFISLLVPAKNEEKVIADTIASLLALDYAGPEGPHFEIIAIDDASTDGTFAVLQRIAMEEPRLQVLQRSRLAIQGKSAALNDAFPLTKGEVVAVFDADARVAPDFLLRCLPRLLAPEMGAVQAQKRMSNAKPFPLTAPGSARDLVRRSFFLPLLQDVEMLMDTACQISRGGGRGAVELRGNGMLVKREALHLVDGWNNDTLTDDLDLGTRLHAAGWQIDFCPEAVVWEQGVLSWRALYSQRRRWVEGGIRRYLDYGAKLIKADLPLTIKADALIFVAEFALPMWLFFGALVWSLAAAAGLPYDPYVSLAIACGNVAVTLPFVLVVAWRHVTRHPIVYPFVVLAVAIYLLHWLPVIIWTVLRLVALRPQSRWSKTEHLSEAG
jgi:1,2-diacylglycerol 3-beta-glucosyltransferase